MRSILQNSVYIYLNEVPKIQLSEYRNIKVITGILYATLNVQYYRI